VEVPGIGVKDLKVTFQNGVIRVQGHKREVSASKKLLCYHCLERRYGKFDRRISIDMNVDPHRTRAILENGVLTLEIPKLQGRGRLLEIPIEKK
jgi:HSP20 family protein